MMARRERFSPEFAADLVVAVKYYDSISKSTGNRFRKKLDDRLDLILNSPEAFANIHESVRAVRIRSYPYVILYEVLPDHVHFIALVHGAGSRENWFEGINKPK
jgi:mRNA-degrading endonuclease RelE of RelBE toxin-antitoxin system